MSTPCNVGQRHRPRLREVMGVVGPSWVSRIRRHRPLCDGARARNRNIYSFGGSIPRSPSSDRSTDRRNVRMAALSMKLVGSTPVRTSSVKRLARYVRELTYVTTRNSAVPADGTTVVFLTSARVAPHPTLLPLHVFLGAHRGPLASPADAMPMFPPM